MKETRDEYEKQQVCIMNKQEIIKAKKILQADIIRYSKRDIPQNTGSPGLQSILRHRQETVVAHSLAIEALDIVDKLNKQDGYFFIYEGKLHPCLCTESVSYEEDIDILEKDGE